MNRIDAQKSRKAANSSTALGRYKQASLLPLVKLLLTIARPVGADEDPEAQSSGLSVRLGYPKSCEKGHLTATQYAT